MALNDSATKYENSELTKFVHNMHINKDNFKIAICY
jgi:hypothetical protein